MLGLTKVKVYIQLFIFK